MAGDYPSCRSNFNSKGIGWCSAVYKKQRKSVAWMRSSNQMSFICVVSDISNWIIQHNRRIVNEKHNYSERMEIGLRVGNIRIQTQTQQKLPTERCCDAGNGATPIITDQQRKKERCWYPFNGNKMRRMLPCRISSAWNQMNYPGICSESLALLFDTKALRLFIECECLCAG